MKLISESCQEVLTSLSSIPHSFVFIPLGLGILFLITVIFNSLFITVQTLKLKRKLAARKKPHDSLRPLLEKLHVENDVYLLKSHLLFAFCYGFWNPKIYLSSAIFLHINRRELETILRHEKYHLKHNDTIRMFILSVLQPIAVFLPIFKDVLQANRIKREIEADKYAVTGLTNKSSLFSSEKKTALLGVMQKILRSSPETVAFVPAMGSYGTFEARIYALTTNDFQVQRFSFLNSILSMLILIAMLFSVLSSIYIHRVYAGNEQKTICPAREIQNASFPYSPAR